MILILLIWSIFIYLKVESSSYSCVTFENVFLSSFRSTGLSIINESQSLVSVSEKNEISKFKIDSKSSFGYKNISSDLLEEKVYESLVGVEVSPFNSSILWGLTPGENASLILLEKDGYLIKDIRDMSILFSSQWGIAEKDFRSLSFVKYGDGNSKVFLYLYSFAKDGKSGRLYILNVTSDGTISLFKSYNTSLPISGSTFKEGYIFGLSNSTSQLYVKAVDNSTGLPTFSSFLIDFDSLPNHKSGLELQKATSSKFDYYVYIVSSESRNIYTYHLNLGSKSFVSCEDNNDDNGDTSLPNNSELTAWHYTGMALSGVFAICGCLVCYFACYAICFMVCVMCCGNLCAVMNRRREKIRPINESVI